MAHTAPLPLVLYHRNNAKHLNVRACITFSQISNHIYNQLIKMLEFCSSRFMHYNLDMRPLQGNHNMFCDIHIFSATTTTEALHFSIQELAIVECSGHVQVKFCVIFLWKENYVWLFHAKIKFCVCFCGTTCAIIFFQSLVTATKISMKVLHIETK